MLTPHKINELIKMVSTKHTKPLHGLYPSQKKIIDYIARQTSSIAQDPNLEEINKVKEMTNLLEGFVRYLNNTNKILKLDIDKILTYIYYPEIEEATLNNKDNLYVGSKGQTVRLWHDAYYSTNRRQIINRLIECKNVLYAKAGLSQSHYIQEEDGSMPEQMQKKYEEMFNSYQNRPLL